MIPATMTPRTSGRNRVRIIAGKWRSRVVRFPAAAQLRPTPDRVRETLFNWLGQNLDGLACLDLFAGSGALGLEASSRGARRVVMVESDPKVAAALRESARSLGAEGVDVVTAEALAEFKSALALDAEHVKARFFLGLAAEQDGRVNDAVATWRALLDSAPPGAPWAEFVRAAFGGRAARTRPLVEPPPRAAPDCHQQHGRHDRHQMPVHIREPAGASARSHPVKTSLTPV